LTLLTENKQRFFGYHAIAIKNFSSFPKSPSTPL
jgi:hypothetical protein